MGRTTWRGLDDRLRDVLAPDLDRAQVASAVYGELSHRIPFTFACLATTDPASGLITWTSKTRDLGVGDQEFAATEYGPPDVNSFESLAQRTPAVGALWLDTDGRPETCRRHRTFMQPRFGFTDELRAVLLSRGTSWGALGVYRGEGDPPFSTDDVAEVAAACGTIASALQRSLFRLGPADAAPDVSGTEADGPAVLIVDASDGITHLTPAARSAIDDLGGWDHGHLPPTVLALVARTRTSRTSATTRSLVAPGRWMSLRAAPLDGADGSVDVVVSIEPTPRATLSRMALAAHGLTAREEEVALLVLQGLTTQSISSTLHLSPHTVQDHLKAIFAKVGVGSRRELTARLVLV